MTNKQWLKSLNDKKLSHFLAKSFLADIACFGDRYCPYYNEMTDELADCDKCILYWFEQEYKEDDCDKS